MLSLFGFRRAVDSAQAMRDLEEKVRAYAPGKLDLPQGDPSALFDLLAQQGVNIPMNQRVDSIGQRSLLKTGDIQTMALYLSQRENLTIPEQANIGYLTNYLYDQFVATAKPAYENCLYLLVLAGHADAATKLGDHYSDAAQREPARSGQLLGMAGYYYLVGAFLPQDNEGNNFIDPVNAIRGARLVITLQARTGVPSPHPHLPLALAMLEHVVVSDQSPSGLGQNAQAALSLLTDAHLMQVRFSEQEVKALRFNPQSAVTMHAAPGDAVNSLGLALHFMQRYHTESPFQDNFLQLHYRVSSGYNDLGVELQHFRNPQVEYYLCHILKVVAPNVPLLDGVEGSQNLQIRIGELEQARGDSGSSSTLSLTKGSTA